MAEREYAAANARIGVAKADFFPHITLGGFLGFLAGRSNDFGSPATRAWSLAPSISCSRARIRTASGPSAMTPPPTTSPWNSGAHVAAGTS